MLFGKYVNQFYKKYWYHLFFGVLFLIFVDVVQLFIPDLVGWVVGIFEDNDPIVMESFWNGGFLDPNSYISFLLSFLWIGLGMAIGRGGWRIFINRLGVKIDRDIRLMLFSHAEKLSIDFYNNQKVGSLMSLFNNDLQAVKAAFTEAIVFAIDGGILGGLAMVKLFQINWFLALLACTPLLVLALSGGIIGKAASKKYGTQLKAFERLSAFTQENISGIQVIKAFVREHHEMKEFYKHNKNNKDTNMEYLKFSVFLNALDNILIFSMFILIVFVGGLFAFGAKVPDAFLVQGPFNGESISKFLLTFDMLIWPMFAVSMLIDILARSKASLKKITAFLDTPIDLKDTDNTDGLPQFDGSIKFNNLSFTYPGDENPSLSGINIEIKKGETLGIIGRTGSGKSTLVKILTKIYNIDDDNLYFSGVDINKWPSKVIRDNIGYVAQNSFLFSDLIENNIAFGDGEENPEQVKRAAAFACVDGAIEEFKDGYKTLIGEKGTTLSGGQRQRVAMARAIFKNPTILILDDSVSAVDSETEMKILKNIKELRTEGTTLIISSRISAVESLDHILVLEDGKVIGYGKHKELLESCEYYKNIAKLQQLEKEVKHHGE